MLPNELKEMFYRENSTLLMLKYEEDSSSPLTQQAILDIRKVLDKEAFFSRNVCSVEGY